MYRHHYSAVHDAAATQEQLEPTEGLEPPSIQITNLTFCQLNYAGKIQGGNLAVSD